MLVKRVFFVILVAVVTVAMAFGGGTQEPERARAVEPERGVLGMPSGIRYWATIDLFSQDTGEVVPEFSESPVLTRKVEAGELPPLSQRLPADVLVVKPKDEIGRFGGTLNTTATSPTGGGAETWPANRQYMFRRIFPNMATDIQPNIAKGYEWGDSFRSITIFLREGMRWSDGEPLTSRDFIFWWEDMILNTDFTPVIPIEWRPGGEPMIVTAVDDYTVRFDFAAPNPAIIDRLTVGENPFKPMHYLKQYHPTHNPNAQENARAAGFESWTQHLAAMDARGWGEQVHMNPNLPEVNTWVLDRVDSFGNKYYVRNPYYWKVDPAGQQLPYMDFQTRHLVSGAAAIDLKVMAGELTMSTHFLRMENMPLYRENESRGNYTTYVTRSGQGNRLGFMFNLTVQDPVKREVFNDLRFREAMSLAINRQELNDLYFYGQALINQFSPNPDVTFWEEWMQTHMTEYDPAGANRRLDQIGMTRRDSEGFRLGPDGRRFAINIEYHEMDGPRGPMLEVVKENWEDVGIRVTLRELAQDLYGTRVGANELDLAVWVIENTTEVGMRVTNMQTFRPDFQGSGIPWRLWLDTNGADGEEPPEEIKELDAWTREWMLTTPDDPRYFELGRKIATRATENLYAIGTIGLVPQPMILNNNVVNGPDGTMIWAAEYRFWLPYQAEQWYYR